MRRWDASPASGFGDAVVKPHLAVPGQQQRHCVVANLVHAVVGDIGDGDAQLGGGGNGDVVHAHPVAADDAAAAGGADYGGGDLGEAGHNGIAVGCQLRQRGL